MTLLVCGDDRCWWGASIVRLIDGWLQLLLKIADLVATSKLVEVLELILDEDRARVEALYELREVSLEHLGLLVFQFELARIISLESLIEEYLALI